MSVMEDGRRVVIDPADVNESDGTVKGALLLCCGSIGEPMGYNPLQSMYFALIREYSCRDEGAVPEETSAARQKRIRALYQEVLSDLWGVRISDPDPASAYCRSEYRRINTCYEC